MASAWVTCQACRLLVPFGDEHWRNNKSFCKKCYDEGKEVALAKAVSKMEKASGFGATPSKKTKTKTPEKCESCSGSEVRCVKCGGLLCKPVNGEECEQRKHGKMCTDCFEKAMGN